MTVCSDYPPGAPCWVETVQPDPEAAARFYGPLLGWDFDPPAPASRDSYLSARVRGRLVAGIGQASDAAVWVTYVRVDSVEKAITAARAAGGALLVGALLVGPHEAGEDGRLAILSDVTGVAFGVWEAGRRKGAERVNEPGTWAMSALHASDPEACGRFYGAIFGWQVEAVPGSPLSFFRLPGYEGGEDGQPFPRDVVAVMTPAAAGVPRHWAVNFRVDDADATAAHAISLGGSVLMEPVDTPGLRSAALADPQGGVIAVSAPAAVGEV